MPSSYDPWSACKPQAVENDGRDSPCKERQATRASLHGSEQQVNRIPEMDTLRCADLQDGVFKGHGLRSRTDSQRLEPKRLSAG
eukprot:2732551-Amphidinium_carterae.1